jgi:uncharacterized membrane protein YwzB
MFKIKTKKINFFAAVFFAAFLFVFNVNLSSAQTIQQTVQGDYQFCLNNPNYKDEDCEAIFLDKIAPLVSAGNQLPLKFDCRGYNQNICQWLGNTGHYTVTTDSTRGVSGSPCGSGQPACGEGLECSGSPNNICVVSNGTTPTPNPGSTLPPTPTINLPEGCIKNPACPEGLCDMGNGLCLPPGQPTKGIAASRSLTELLVDLIKILLGFAGLVAVVIVVIGGFWYMTSGGNEELAEKGKKTMLNFVLGLAVIILAYTIVNILADLLTSNKHL